MLGLELPKPASATAAWCCTRPVAVLDADHTMLLIGELQAQQCNMVSGEAGSSALLLRVCQSSRLCSAAACVSVQQAVLCC
jgi:hypothetical protein